MLSLLGLDHEALTYLFEGRERRLTDVGGQNDLAERLVKLSKKGTGPFIGIVDMYSGFNLQTKDARSHG